MQKFLEWGWWIAGGALFCCVVVGFADGWLAYVALRQNIPLHGVVELKPGRSRVGLEQYTVQELIIRSAVLLSVAIVTLMIGGLCLRRSLRNFSKR